MCKRGNHLQFKKHTDIKKKNKTQVVWKYFKVIFAPPCGTEWYYMGTQSVSS